MNREAHASVSYYLNSIIFCTRRREFVLSV
jgi:hypothetical protein